MDGTASINKNPQLLIAGLRKPPEAEPLAAKIAAMREKHMVVSAEGRACRPGAPGVKFNPARENSMELKAARLAVEANALADEVAVLDGRWRAILKPYADAVERALTPSRQVAMRALADALRPGRPIPPAKDFAVDRIDVRRCRYALAELEEIDAAMRGAGVEGFGLRSWIEPPLNWSRIANRLFQYRSVTGG